MRISVLLIAAISAFAQASDFSPQSPAFTPVIDQPGLPRVLLIGDSISIGYTVTVRKELAGQASIHRILENGADTANGLKKIDGWLGDSKWDVIHFNWGLHDLKVTADGGRQVPIETYETNLALLVARLKRTGARLIWAATTPVPNGKQNPPREPADPPKYNAAAKRVMETSGIATNDLYTAALPRLSEIQLPINVHFNNTGWEFLGKQVAAAIRSELHR